MLLPKRINDYTYTYDEESSNTIKCYSSYQMDHMIQFYLRLNPNDSFPKITTTFNSSIQHVLLTGDKKRYMTHEEYTLYIRRTFQSLRYHVGNITETIDSNGDLKYVIELSKLVKTFYGQSGRLARHIK